MHQNEESTNLICLHCSLWIWMFRKRRKKDYGCFFHPAAMCAPVSADQNWYKADNTAPLFDGLEVLNFSIFTKNKLVQRYFNQGLILAFAFNHAEATRSFYDATKLDSSCAMAYWDYALRIGGQIRMLEWKMTIIREH